MRDRIWIDCTPNSGPPVGSVRREPEEDRVLPGGSIPMDQTILEEYAEEWCRRLDVGTTPSWADADSKR